MQGLIYFQSASSGYIPLTQSHTSYENKSNKNLKSATNKEGEWRGTESHQDEEACTFYGGYSSMLKNGKVVSNLSALN
jgi:hypothetical protein